MKRNIVKSIKKNLPENWVGAIKAFKYHKRCHTDMSLFDILRKSNHVYAKRSIDDEVGYVYQLGKTFQIMHIDCDTFYIYPFDEWTRRIPKSDLYPFASVTVDYSDVLRSDLKKMRNDLAKDDCKNSFAHNEILMINNIYSLNNRILNVLSSRSDERSITLASFFNHFLDEEPESLDEAFQKILFFNALFWQAGHNHNGLGRLDLILYPYYQRDISSGKISQKDAEKLVTKFFLTLARDFREKSVTIKGDTGQYIMLGGIDSHGVNTCNEMTFLFIKVCSELKIPDPKLILRANDDMPEQLWDETLKCILTGCGSPLLMNEKMIMNTMMEFGYKKEDVWNMGTSACWEPLIIGKSFDQNNALSNIPSLEVLNKLISNDKHYETFDDFMASYKTNLKKYILSFIHDIHYDCSPLYSLFFRNCLNRKKDFTRGGAVYNWHGAQIVSFPNTINALLNIKKYVFDTQLLSLADCKNAIQADFNGYEDIREMCMSNSLKYGNNENDVISLSNDLMRFISDVIEECTLNGEKMKVGFSSSAYISSCKNVGASLDGRHSGEPFAVHISPISSSIGISEILNFASALDFSSNRLNGNVVDFIISTGYLRQQNKLKSILRQSIQNGVFEIQLNVLDASTLRDAKEHPEKYPNLVVRVWGFSAYFNELPVEYKDNLIKRAELYAS